MQNKPRGKSFELLLLSILSISFLFGFVSAQQNIHFKHLTINDGLSHNWIHSIIQDKNGFIWIGTDDGLDRYDGYNFHVYKYNSRDKYSISSSNIMAIAEDRKGHLWIGTRKGLVLYDRQNDRFIRHPKLPELEIFSIAIDKDGNLWIGTGTNVYHVRLIDDSVTTYTQNDIMNSQARFASGNNALLIEEDNSVWIGSVNGLHLYDKEKNSFINYSHDERNPNSISSNNVRSILKDKAGRLWIGTSSGLDLFINAKDRTSNGIFIHYQNDTKNQNSISKGMILSLFEDNKNNLWIGTENGGLDFLDLNNYKKNKIIFVHFKNDPTRQISLSNNSIYSIFQDKQRNIWIGTFGNGIDIINPIADKFIHFMNEPGIKNSLSSNQVNTFFDDGDFLWIGTEGGLNRYDRKNDTFKHYLHDPMNRNSISSNSIWAIYKDSRGNLWIGTWGGGLNRFDYRTETFGHYYNDLKDTTSIGSNNIFSVYEDRDGNLWIGTMGGGLNMLDRKKGRFIRYNISNTNIKTNYVQTIIESREGDLWFVNVFSFVRFERKTGRFTNYEHFDTDSTSLSSNKVISIFEDSKGHLWMGTDAGLNLFNKSTEKFTCYQVEDGLPNNSINSILEDDRGNLWLATNKGLSKFVDAINTPVKVQFKNYTFEDGLQSNGFGKRSCLKDRKGMLYFGGSNGFNVFDPDKIVENTYVPPIVVTEFQIFNRPVNIGDKGQGTDENKDLVLSYTQSIFSFEFAALNYIASQKNQYAYKMEGFDNDWNYVGTKHSATYTNLSPGKYIFKVKGSNNDNIWNEEGTAIHITITPPFWQTLWFRAIILIIIAGCAYWIYKWRRQVRNFAEQRRLDAVIERERNLLRTLIDNWPDYIYIKDLESRFMVGNAAFLRRLGYSSEGELLGKTDFDLFPHEKAEKFVADERKIIESGEGLHDSEDSAVDPSKEDKEIFVSTTKVPLRDARGEIVGIIGIGRDVTARKKSETERERLITELQNALNDIKTLSGLVPICANCKKIRDDQGYWTQLEAYIQDRSDAKFSHSICPDCAAKIYPNYNIKKQ